jgi:hypothetical protein
MDVVVAHTHMCGGAWVGVVSVCRGKSSVAVASAATDNAAPRALVVATQTFKFDEKEHAPVSKPVPKVEGGLQCSGEAQFTDDIPPQTGTLYAAIVASTEARAVVCRCTTTLTTPHAIHTSLTVPCCAVVMN